MRHFTVRLGIVLGLSLMIFACDDGAVDDSPDAGVVDAQVDAQVIASPLEQAVAAISPTRLKADVDFLASDALGGRAGGTPGHAAARAYLIDALESAGVEPFGDDGGFEQSYPTMGRSGSFVLSADGMVVPHENDTGTNVVGLVRAADPAHADKYIVYVAHYDHLGVDRAGDPFNGAFDNAGGTAVGLELARVISQFGAAPACNLVLLFSDDEEAGLRGAAHWVASTEIPRSQIVVGISGDPLGRALLPDYAPIVLAGLERSPALSAVWRETAAFTENDLVYLHRAMIPVFASDQDEFHAQGIPGVWFITPGMSFYHTVDDAPLTIDYRVLLDASRYILQSIHHVAATGRTFAYEGEPALAVSHAADVKVILDGTLASEVLTMAERQQIAGFSTQLDEVMAAGTFDVLSSPVTWFAVAVAVIALNLPRAHPGEVPPPFPGE